MIFIILKKYNVNPKNIEVEITESGSIKNIEYNISVMKKLSQMGINISIDDFGTGFSSFSNITRLPFHTLKIDQSFIFDLDNNKEARITVRAIIQLAKSLKKKVVAEGVESKSQFDFLIENECGFIQRFYFSRPLSPSEIIYS